MAGVTATINVESFRADWQSGLPLAELCSRWTITKDQLIRLRVKLQLPARTDRSVRYKPPREPGPDEDEEAASRDSLALAPQIAERVTSVQAQWSEQTRLDRTVAKSSPMMLRWINAADLVQRVIEANRQTDD